MNSRSYSQILLNHLKRSFELSRELVEGLSESELELKLKNLPSNTIGQQIWCMIGARESYLKAIEKGGWAGFSCSLTNASSKDDVLTCLIRSQNDFLNFLQERELDEGQVEYLVTLLEHEIQHHGQLIRYFYANKLIFPKSWNDRYTV